MNDINEHPASLLQIIAIKTVNEIVIDIHFAMAPAVVMVTAQPLLPVWTNDRFISQRTLYVIFRGDYYDIY